MRYKSQRLTDLISGTVLRPYVPHGAKKIGEGEAPVPYFADMSGKLQKSRTRQKIKTLQIFPICPRPPLMIGDVRVFIS